MAEQEPNENTEIDLSNEKVAPSKTAEEINADFGKAAEAREASRVAGLFGINPLSKDKVKNANRGSKILTRKKNNKPNNNKNKRLASLKGFSKKQTTPVSLFSKEKQESRKATKNVNAKKKAVADFNSKIKESEQKLQTAKAKLPDLEEKLRKAEEAIAPLNAALAFQKKRTDLGKAKKEEAIKAAQDNVDAAQKNLEPIRAEIAEAKETVKREEAAVKNIKASKSPLENELQTAEAAAIQAKKSLQEKRSEFRENSNSGLGEAFKLLKQKDEEFEEKSKNINNSEKSQRAALVAKNLIKNTLEENKKAEAAAKAAAVAVQNSEKSTEQLAEIADLAEKTLARLELEATVKLDALSAARKELKLKEDEFNPIDEEHNDKPKDEKIKERFNIAKAALTLAKAKVATLRKEVEDADKAFSNAKKIAIQTRSAAIKSGVKIEKVNTILKKLNSKEEYSEEASAPEPASEAVPKPPSEPVPEPPSEPAPEPAPEPVAAEATPVTNLPPGWEEHRNNEGQVYYSNGTTTQWERPNGSSVSTTKPTEEIEAQLTEEKAAKAAIEAELTALKGAKEAAEAEVAELKASKEAAETELTEMKAAKEAAEAEVAELKASKEAVEAEVVELKKVNKPQETNSEPTSPTNSNSKNTNSNNPQPSDEEKILQVLKNGDDGFPPLELPDTLKTNFEHAIKPFYDKTKALPPNQAYVELYVKLYVLFYEVKKEKIPDGDLFEEGTKTDLAEFLTDDVKQKIKEQVTNAPYYDLMFRLGISKLYHESLTDTLHIIDNLDQIDLTSDE